MPKFALAPRECLKGFGFLAYSVGMLVLLTQMIVEANIKNGVLLALRAFPPAQLAAPTAFYLLVTDSLPGLVLRITFNLSIWVFWLGVSYLLFFWKRHLAKLDRS
ncbi:MAG: hypothetical protein ABJB97_12225 [Acidobacteriota bacterium]